MGEYRVRRIPPKQTHEWLLKKHYAHRIPSISFAFGLYDSESVLQGICTIGKPASPNLCFGICGEIYSEKVYELNRLCVNDNQPKNTSSYFVGRVLRNLHLGIILVSYADTAQSHIGYIYQATNWLYTGETKERTDIAVQEGTHSRHYKKSENYPERKLRSAKHRYVYFLGTRRQKDEMRKSLKYAILPYPKGDNQRYDASYEPQVQGVLI